MVNILWVRAGLWSRLVIYLLLLAAAVFTVVPFLWAIVNSVKTLTETFQLGAVIPFLNFEPTLDSWREVLADPQTSSAFVSSCVISAGTTIFALLLGVPAAYSLARYEFPMPANDIALWFLSQRVLPPSLDGLVVSAVLVFAFSWNEALFASALTSQQASPFSALVLASRSTRGVDFNTAGVMTLIGIVPPVIFYFFIQRYLARGLSFGAVKG